MTENPTVDAKSLSLVKPSGDGPAGVATRVGT